MRLRDLAIHLTNRLGNPDWETQQWSVHNTAHVHLQNLCAQKLELPAIAKVNVYLGPRDEEWDGDTHQGITSVHQFEPPGLFDFSDTHVFQLKLLDLVDAALRKIAARLGISSEPLDIARAQSIESGFKTQNLLTKSWLHNESKTLSARVWMRSQFGHVDIVCEARHKKEIQTYLLMQCPPAPAFTGIKRVEWGPGSLRLVVQDRHHINTVFGIRTYDVSGTSLKPIIEKSLPGHEEIFYSYPIPGLLAL